MNEEQKERAYRLYLFVKNGQLAEFLHKEHAFAWLAMLQSGSPYREPRCDEECLLLQECANRVLVEDACAH